MKNEKKQEEEQGKDGDKSFTQTCYNCRKKGHIKPYFPLFKKVNKKFKKNQKKKKAYCHTLILSHIFLSTLNQVLPHLKIAKRSYMAISSTVVTLPI